MQNAFTYLRFYIFENRDISRYVLGIYRIKININKTPAENKTKTIMSFCSNGFTGYNGTCIGFNGNCNGPCWFLLVIGHLLLVAC